MFLSANLKAISSLGSELVFFLDELFFAPDDVLFDSLPPSAPVFCQEFAAMVRRNRRSNPNNFPEPEKDPPDLKKAMSSMIVYTI